MTLWVNFICRDWPPEDPFKQCYEEIGVQVDVKEDVDDDCVEEYEPIEGCTDEDVGWAKLKYRCLVDVYDFLSDPDRREIAER